MNVKLEKNLLLSEKMLTSNRICVIGLEYVGLPTAVVFAGKGYEVVGVDVDAKKVEAVNGGRCYLREPGLDVFLCDVVSKGSSRATSSTV
jgi:UDP-N-acetyl-D-mannosaminuronic acid dehydrogenase